MSQPAPYRQRQGLSQGFGAASSSRTTVSWHTMTPLSSSSTSSSTQRKPLQYSSRQRASHPPAAQTRI
eukprot:7355737-Lingulodinium_polyedra.AAC.1